MSYPTETLTLDASWLRHMGIYEPALKEQALETAMIPSAHIPQPDRHQGLDKVARYHWRMRDKPGNLVELNKGLLSIDPEYQREPNEDKISALANDWSWVACGALIVASRVGPDGGLFVVDGQHRYLAALKRSDITDLPCIVFETLEMKDEAEGFLAANTLRRPLGGVDKFKALVASDDHASICAEALVADAGRRVSRTSSTTTVACVASLTAWIRRDEEATARIWPLVVAVCNEQVLHDIILSGLVDLELRLEGGSLLEARWSKRVQEIGFSGLLNSAQKAAAFYARGGAKVWGLGMLKEINKRARTHALRVVGETGNEEQD